MGKKLALFSDLHSDNRNLSLIADYLRDSNVLSGVFLGDAVYDTMSTYSNVLANAAGNMRNQLRQESPLREAIMDGNYSEEQIRMFANAFQHGIDTAKKVSKAEYGDINEILSGLEVAILGGNWDHGPEMEETFGENYLDANSMEVAGLKMFGVSGGGSPSTLSATTEVLADNNTQDQGYHYKQWVKDPAKFQRGMANADILLSHVPVSYGENVERNGEPSHGVLKDLYMKSGANAPKINFHGHTHGINVKFDEDTGALLACPGSCSNNHNDNASFLVAKFSDDDLLIGLEQYEILASLEGLKEVVLTGYHTIDWESREVEFEDRNETVLREHDVKTFTDNLSLDDNLRLIGDGLNVNYATLDTARDKDLQLRVNLIVMGKEIEKVTDEVKTIIEIAAREYLLTEDRKYVNDNLEEAITFVKEELAKKAAKVLGVNCEVGSNQYERELFNSAMIRTIYGIDGSTIVDQFRNVASQSEDQVRALSYDLANTGRKSLSNQYQSHILKPLEASNYQEMAELYIPANYERKRDIHDRGEAIQFWANSYASEQGGLAPLMTAQQVESNGAYQKIEDHEGRKWTKEELADLFGFDLDKPEDDPEDSDGPDGSGISVTPEQAREIDKILRNGKSDGDNDEGGSGPDFGPGQMSPGGIYMP